MKRIALLIIFTILNVITGCTNQQVFTNQGTPPTTVPTFIPVPTTTFLPQSTEDVSVAANRPENIQSIAAFYNGQIQNVRTIRFADAYLVKKNLAGYVLINYSKQDQIYIAVSVPVTFEIGQYDITQPLKTYPSYSATDVSLPAAIFRSIPAELSAFGEPETEGEACDQFVSGLLSITNKKPLQGYYQFRCMFQNGQRVSVAGKFSQ